MISWKNDDLPTTTTFLPYAIRASCNSGFSVQSLLTMGVATGCQTLSLSKSDTKNARALKSKYSDGPWMDPGWARMGPAWTPDEPQMDPGRTPD